jgi:glycosyltransferase involved in cell wall biosynthesis
VQNIFKPLAEQEHISISNLIMLDLLNLENNNHTLSTDPKIDCLSIGYTSIKNPLSIFKFISRGLKFVKTHKKKDANNILYNYQYPDIRNFIFILYAKLIGFKIVFDIVENKSHEKRNTLNDKIRYKLTMGMLKTVPYYSSSIFVISYQLVEDITKIIHHKTPVHLLPVSVNFKNINISKKIKTEHNPIKIFYGGSFGKKDGIVYLLDAINKIDTDKYDYQLILTGKGLPADMEIIYQAIENNPRIIYKGLLSEQAYFQNLSEMDICCMTRNNSAFANAGFPFKLGEYLAAGKLIIASKVGDVGRYLTHKENAFLVQPEKSSEIL